MDDIEKPRDDGSDISKKFAGKSVFITGGTGFVGLCLVNKLLMSCPDVKTIYLLLRPKKNKDIQDRLKDIAKNAIFETLLYTESEDIFKKLYAVAGDVGEENLGLSQEDRNLLINNVNVVFHSAATLDFAETLKKTVDVNLLGTRRIVQLCKQIKNLEALVHVSSVYVNSYKLEASEQLYPKPADPEEIIRLVNELSEKELDAKTPEILRDHPNTYTFTKHLAEHEVNNSAGQIPCAIVRPSMITAAWKEPVPGWTISKNGPQGFLMGASKGIIRRLPVGTDLVYDYIPVDVVVNELIVAAYHVMVTKPNTLKIFQCCSSSYKPFKWNMIQHKINEYLHSFPLKSAVWYPHLKFVESVRVFKLIAFFVHMIPAFILDFVTKLAGGRPILVRLHTNVNNSLDRLEKFIFTEWKFDNKKTLELQKTLNKTDREKFNIDIGTLDWESYFIDLTQGVRRYLNNEGVKTLEAARGKDTLLLFAHVILQLSIYALLWFIFACILGTTMVKSAFIVPIAYVLLSQL
ncbi:putative fatty acyl-CoA reductase CG8306 [Chrysoperla carnea]|uniref:putative fatty acyl-CoA reductase CG8306 n=1 Tax=Chrysoperla carnea TaxID=189513 RepID=UPI001D095E35|nr:putative fatty acyl-CoA reductase CG8306 [Chrysoperla carnea]